MILGGYFMGITVATALTMEVMSQTKIIAGKTGLHREIKWVNVMELLDEVSSLQEGELLITTAFDLADSPSLLDELIPYLAKRNLAGLAIQTGYYLDSIPSTIIEKCDEYNFPLLELPKHIVFSEVTKAIGRQIINSQMAMLEYAQLIHNRLTLIILQNEGLPQVAKVLSELIKTPVRILDTYFNLLTYSGLDKA
jgi:purine catabolism regulator